MRPAVVALALLIALVAAGCGSKVELGQVEGTVRAGGQPLRGVLVTFVPESSGPAAVVRSMGVTDEAGRFRLRTETQEDGAIVGRHKVLVEDLAIYSAPRSEDGTVLKRPPQRFAPAYSDLLQSPLSQEVKAGPQSLELVLD
jgi:hypothetical protein